MPRRARKHIPLIEKLAAALACLLPEDVRNDLRAREVPAKEVVSLFEFHHIRLHSLGYSDDWHNLHPFTVAQHDAQKRRDIRDAAKAKRIMRKNEDAQRRMLAKAIGERLEELSPRRRKIPSRPFPKVKRKLRSRGFEKRRAS